MTLTTSKEIKQGYLKRKGVAKANPQVYIIQRYWEDDYNSVH